jgi:TfoX/Sxy family transcriptional regulator of competence genes
MAYDPQLAARLRTMVAGRCGVTEKAMFGGLAFMIDGKMFCGVLGDELLARVGPDAHDAALARPHVRIMDFTGRPMRGYVFVGPQALQADTELTQWVEQAQRHAAALPKKGEKGSGRRQHSKTKEPRVKRKYSSGRLIKRSAPRRKRARGRGRR